MAITKTPRFGLNRWDSGSDPFNRLLADADNLQIETLGAVFRSGSDASKGDPTSQNHIRSFYFATDTSTLYFSNGVTWITLNDPGESGDISSVTTGATAFAGTSTTSSGVTTREFALADHVHPTGTPALPANIGTTASTGTANGGTPAADNHVHRLGSGSIDNSSLFVSGVVSAAALGVNSVTTDKLVDLNVTNTKIASNAITRDKLGSGLEVLQSFTNTSARNVGIPSPTEGRLTYLQDRDVVSYHTGTQWVDLIAGTPLSGNGARLDCGSPFSF
jgi:hypothetical protein